MLPSLLKRLKLMRVWHFFFEMISVSTLSSSVECQLSSSKRLWQSSRYFLAVSQHLVSPSSITRVWGKWRYLSSEATLRSFNAEMSPLTISLAFSSILLILLIFSSQKLATSLFSIFSLNKIQDAPRKEKHNNWHRKQNRWPHDPIINFIFRYQHPDHHKTCCTRPKKKKTQ